VARHFGLAIDNLTAVDVVTADGQFRQANAEQNADLFWGVRGGGGNFGVVTSFEFQLHPMPRQVIGGAILYPIERARETLRLYAQYLPEAPDALDIIFLLLQPGGGQPGATGFAVCYSGAPSGADRALAPLRGLGTPLVDAGPVDYVALQRSGDIDDPRARASYLKSGFVADIPEELITSITEGFEGKENRSVDLFVQPAKGAIGRVANEATAFAQRDALGNLGVGVDWAFGSDPAEHVAWIKQYWTHIEPFTQGFYTNDADPESYTRPAITRTYRENYPRLVEIKNKYDPHNLFRLNANIIPTA